MALAPEQDMATTTDHVSSWGYISDEVMADGEGRTAVVDQRRIYLVAQMKKRGLQAIGDVVVTRLDEKAEDAPPGCSGYRFEIGQQSVTQVSDKEFFTNGGVEYVREGGDEPRVARPGERYASAADAVHAQRKPYGRQYGAGRS